MTLNLDFPLPRSHTVTVKRPKPKHSKSFGKNFQTVQLSLFLKCDWRIWRLYCSMVHCFI